MSIRLLRLAIMPLLLESFAGCASSSAHDPAYQKRVHTLCAPAAACVPHVPATVPPVEPPLEGAHSINFYVQAALTRNPDILAAERQVAAQAERVPQVTSLPDASLTGTFFPSSNQTVQTAGGQVIGFVTIAQQFPWCGKLRRRGEAAKLDTKIALTQLAETQLRVIEAVKLAYYDIYYNKQALKILDESERTLRTDFIDPARAGLTKTVKLDLMRGEVELVKLQNQRIDLQQRLQQAQADLAKLLSTSPNSYLMAADPADLPAVPDQLDRLYQAALISRPELQGQLQTIARDERLVALARLNYFPDVTAGFFWYDASSHNAIAKTANGEQGLGIAIGLTLPIWEQKNRASVREAQNRQAKDVRLYQSSRDETLRRIRRLTVQALSQEQQVQLLEKQLIPAAVEALRIAHEGHKTGAVNPVRVVDNWLQLMTQRLQLARLETSLGQTLAALERVVGEQLMPMKDVPGSAACSPIGVSPPAQPGLDAGQDQPPMRRDESLPPPQRLDAAPPDEPE
jgi:cobalt-zinc-cadmium efflux system outer membrane protein